MNFRQFASSSVDSRVDDMSEDRKKNVVVIGEDDEPIATLLRDVEGFAYEEIATITSTEIGTVKSRIHRGRLAVRNVLISRGWRGSGG